LVFENAEGDVKEFTHNSTTDGQIGKLSTLKDGDPRLEWLTPTPSDSGRHIKGLAEEGVADFAKASFAVNGIRRK
jgi:hypothetical protein